MNYLLALVFSPMYFGHHVLLIATLRTSQVDNLVRPAVSFHRHDVSYASAVNARVEA